jgi:hypothetical protein
MDADLVLTAGIVLLVLAVPTLLAAWAESRPPRFGAILSIGGLGMIVTALVVKPGGYVFNQIPGVMVDVVARFFN